VQNKNRDKKEKYKKKNQKKLSGNVIGTKPELFACVQAAKRSEHEPDQHFS